MDNENKATMTQAQLNEFVKTIVEDTVDLSDIKGLNEQVEALSTAVKGANKEATKAKADSGLLQARLIKAHIEVSRKKAKEGSLDKPFNQEVADYITEKYAKTDPAFVQEVNEKVKDLLASGNGGNLIVEEYATGFLDQLWNQTILNELGVRFLPTKSGNLTYSKIVEGVAAGYVPETGMIDTSTMRFGSIRLSVKKLMALVPVSNDLLRMASDNVDAMVRDNLIEQMSQVMSKVFLYGKGGEFEPRGIKNIEGIQTIAAGAATKPSFDLGLDMLAALRKKNVGIEDAVWIMGVDTHTKLQKEVQTSVGRAQLEELKTGKWHGRPVIVTNLVNSTGTNEDLFLIKKDAVLGIQGLDITIDQSGTASFMTADGMVSAYHADYTVTRAITTNDFGLSHKEAAVYANIDLA